MNNINIGYEKEESSLVCDNCKFEMGFLLIFWDPTKPECYSCEESSNPESSFFCMSCSIQKRIFESQIYSCHSCDRQLGVAINDTDATDYVCQTCNHDFVNDRTEVYFLCPNCRLKIG
ncbi:hypothetical protein AAA799E16_01652 [Marine Group I thaumarchaeote SCGC AAA799-E16]|uniref:Uncharacterized protein n=2 Tax=Marine Group I TaxID=905826 RepID=A0A087RXX5_9ARCH|nr:hypothetical protein AAA799E16_01652 [Marine Group I thaumarchaeote SCGC AAA799-E16]KFM18329.1 hypothetical protein SCCGRSA3_01248 [Marine Group I thaumarchaeote SCGC RSA3]